MTSEYMKVDPIPIHIDNIASVATIENAKYHAQPKYIDIKHHWIRKVVSDGDIAPVLIPRAGNIADAFYRPLPRMVHEKFFGMMGLSQQTKTATEGCATPPDSDRLVGLLVGLLVLSSYRAF